jgi:AcrR family transcriptional regulator
VPPRARPSVSARPSTTVGRRTPATAGRSANAGPTAVARGRPRDAGADGRILAATFDELVRVGYAALTIEAVAAAAAVARTTVYRRYPTKRDLVIAAFQEEVPFAPPQADLPVRDAIRLLVAAATAALIESGAARILGSLLVEDEREPELLEAFRARIIGPRRELILGILERGIERGEIRPDIDPLVVTEMVAGAVFGHHVILGLTATDAWMDALADHVWRAVKAS